MDTKELGRIARGITLHILAKTKDMTNAERIMVMALIEKTWNHVCLESVEEVRKS